MSITNEDTKESSSRDIGRHNKILADNHKIRVGVVAQCRSKLYNLLYELNESCSLNRTQMKTFLVELLQDKGT